ncbi:MAG: sensor histidine kinase [Phenylobacterium sp.]|nr:sensor histidine kinase [Phenylobacterium sp.]
MWKPVDGSAESAVAVEPPFRAVAEALGLGVVFQIAVTADRASRRFTYVSPNCEAENGVSAEAAMADSRLLFDLILPEHAGRFLAAEEAAHAAGRAFDIEVAMRGPDGEVRWRRISSSPRFLPDGSSLWDGLQADITERHRNAEELEEQRRRVEVAVEATELGLWELDLRSGTLTWSERNRALFGVGSDAPVSMPAYMELVHEEDRPKLPEAYRAARDGAGDFLAEYRIVNSAGEIRWLLSRGRVIGDEEGPRLVVGTTLDITDRRAADERRSLLMGELAHRAKNGIAVVMSIVGQTARGVESVEAFEALLMARLQAMATSQDLVTATGGRPVDIADVISKAVAPFGLARFKVDGALKGVSVQGDVPAGMGLLLHEMATNAQKYGALSNAGGRVVLSRAEAPDGRVAFDWREEGGPAVKAPSRRGFGTRLLQQVLRNQGGLVAFEFEPAGFHAQVSCPAAS